MSGFPPGSYPVTKLLRVVRKLIIASASMLAACVHNPMPIEQREIPQTEQPSVLSVSEKAAEDSPAAVVQKPSRRLSSGDPVFSKGHPFLAGADASVNPPFSWYRLTEVIGEEKAASLIGFVPNELNIVEAANPHLLLRLREKWMAASTRRINVMHFGDSHVQPGVSAQVTRHMLQARGGNAGRGAVFPYALARTYSQMDFRSSFDGEWMSANSIQVTPKIPLGISGFVARTKSYEAGFSLDFSRQFETGPKLIRVLYRVTAPGYKLIVRSADMRWEIELPYKDNGDAESKILDLDFAYVGDTMRFEMRKTSSDPEDIFELHGLIIENQSHGVAYHNLGVGGAAFASLLAQARFVEQSRWLSPDVVILDWGTNDLIYKNKVSNQLEKTIVDTIKKVRNAHPEALILLTSAQDTYFRRRPITATWDFAQLVRRIAREQDCLFYDWYRIAGGRDSIRTWYAYGLAQSDHIHLNTLGYAIKGELFGRALLNSIDWPSKNAASSTPWTDPHRSEISGSVSAWLKATRLFKRRPDLIRSRSVAKTTKVRGKSRVSAPVKRLGTQATKP